jgi:chromosomal replication initiation ATPase DnaA
MITLPNGMTILTKHPPIVFARNRVANKPLAMHLYTAPIGPPSPPRNVREYITLECYASGVSVSEVYGRSRKAEIVRIRQRAMHYAVKRLGMSMPKVGRILKRDHTTVLHGVRVVEAQLNG